MKKIQVKLNDPVEALEETGKYFVKRTEEGFRREVDPSNSKWSSLSPATIADKERKGYPLKILTRTGKMRSSIRYVILKKSVRIEVDFPSQFHQSGTRKMPKRQIIPEGRLSTRDERNIKDIFIGYLDL